MFPKWYPHLSELENYVVTKKEIKTVVNKERTKDKSLSSERSSSIYSFIILLVLYLFFYSFYRESS